jgi:alkanesulfonate monooxygenase SsuD/methylene tetrahydromethanopterin reductase-like flavin-dependent oxidoreductase (luciferase family)
MVAAAVVCADSDEHARWLAGPSALSFLRLRAGRPGLMPTPEEAADYAYTDIEREMIRGRQADQVIGSPETVRRGLVDLLERTQADELMLTTMLHGHADRLRSYELVAALR